MRSLLWSSIDNDDTRDLDQLVVAEPLAGGVVKILVAVADVDALVQRGSAIDEHARSNTTSVYTAARTFPMLPEKLSTDLTSLREDQERLALVIEMTIGAKGQIAGTNVYRALVLNRAKLAYGSVAAWLDGNALAPAALAAVPGLDRQLRQQDEVAQALRRVRYDRGALNFETGQVRPVFNDGVLDGPARRRAQSRERAHRRFHDRVERRGRALPAEQGPQPVARRSALTRALAEIRALAAGVGGRLLPNWTRSRSTLSRRAS